MYFSPKLVNSSILSSRVGVTKSIAKAKIIDYRELEV